MSYKNKIYGLVGALVVLAAILFGYVFNLFFQSNSRLALSILDKKKVQLELQAEQKSFEQSKKSLEKLLTESYQPENFFSNDTSVVREIKAIELMGEQTEVEVGIGVSGTIKTAARAKTVSEVYIVPVTLRVQGLLPNVVAFLEKLEHANFPVNSTLLSANTPSEGEGVVVNLNGNFFVRK